MNLSFLFDRLAGVSIQTAILVAVVFVLTRWLAISPRVRAGLWTLVFAHAVLGMFFAVPVPIFEPGTNHPRTVRMDSREISGEPSAGPNHGFAIEPKTAVIAIWALGAALLILSQFRGERTARRALSQSASAGGATDSLAQMVAAEMGIRRLHVRFSSELSAPCVAGLRCPTVYLPESMRDACEEELRAVFVHELAHVRHGDLAAAILAAAARCLFFFHPMTWVAHREWAIHREAACDAEVLRRSKIGLPAYCDLLIKFAEGRPLLSATIQTATRGFSHLHRRICEMKNTQPKKRGAAPVATIAALVISALAAIPVTLTARSAMTHRPEHASGQDHSITHRADGPTLEAGPGDPVSVQMVPDADEKDPVLKTDVAMSLKDAPFESVIGAIEKAANVTIKAPAVKTEPISVELTANLRTSLDMAAQIAGMSWKRTGDRSFELVPGKADPDMISAGSIATPTIIDPKHLASPEMISAVDAVEAVDMLEGNGQNGIGKGVFLIFPDKVEDGAVTLDFKDAPTEPGYYEVSARKDSKSPTGWSATYKKMGGTRVIDFGS